MLALRPSSSHVQVHLFSVSLPEKGILFVLYEVLKCELLIDVSLHKAWLRFIWKNIFQIHVYVQFFFVLEI